MPLSTFFDILNFNLIPPLVLLGPAVALLEPLGSAVTLRDLRFRLFGDVLVDGSSVCGSVAICKYSISADQNKY